MKKNNKLSLLMIIGAMTIFGSIGIFRKFIPVTSGFLAFIRGAAGTAFLLLFMLITKKKFRHGIGVKKVLLLMLTGALIGVNWMLMFEAYNYVSVSTATLCYYMSPIIVIALSPLFLKERLSVKKVLCVIIAFAGMVLVSGILGGGLAVTDFRGILFALLAACLYASVVLMNKKLPGIDPYEKTALQLFAAALVMVPYLLISGQFVQAEISPLTILLLAAVGLFHTGIAYTMYFGGLEGVQSQTAAILSYIDPVFALILSAVILHEKMGVLEIIGAVLILGASAVSEIDLKRRKKHVER